MVLRDEEDIISDAINNGENHIEFYKNHIYPYKSKLELWYIENISFKTDFYIIWLTTYKVLFPKVRLFGKFLRFTKTEIIIKSYKFIKMNIPLSVPYLSGNENKYIKDCIDTGWISSAVPMLKSLKIIYLLTQNQNTQ